jgi:hypothetical protein
VFIKYGFAISPRDAPEFCSNVSPFSIESAVPPKRGAGATPKGERGKPGARCTRGRVREV